MGVEQQRVKVVVRFDNEDLERLLNERGLGVGYRVRIKISTADQPQGLLLPRSALFRSVAGKWQVFVIRGGRAVLQDIEVGLMNDQQVEAKKGVAEGEFVHSRPRKQFDRRNTRRDQNASNILITSFHLKNAGNNPPRTL